MIGYLMTEDARYRLERLKGTIDLMEHLAAEGSRSAMTNLEWTDFASFTALVSAEVGCVLDDSAGNGIQCDAMDERTFLKLFARLGDQQRRDILSIMQAYACTSDLADSATPARADSGKGGVQ